MKATLENIAVIASTTGSFAGTVGGITYQLQGGDPEAIFADRPNVKDYITGQMGDNIAVAQIRDYLLAVSKWAVKQLEATKGKQYGN